LESVDIKDIEISFDETHHIYKGKPLYSRRFKHVMSFHEPGLAAVEDDTGAYHIRPDGSPAYEQRFVKTYGFYEGIATVVDEGGYFHIDAEGKEIHEERFAWAGNFQEGRCVVRTSDGEYYHIQRDGRPAYMGRYAYAGDFKYGIAVAHDRDGLARHIDRYGKEIHDKRYLELGVYHKGYAIARDERGYFHIDKKGRPLYDRRFEWVEPFYNDYALAKEMDGRCSVIDYRGKTVHRVKGEETAVFRDESRNRLMDYFVGYWKTQIIYALSKSEILQLIHEGKNTEESLYEISNLPPQSVKMLLQIAIIWNLVEKKDEMYHLTYAGRLLLEHEGGLKYASLMWATEHYDTMRFLYDSLKTGKPQFEQLYGEDFFSYLGNNAEYADTYYKAMDEYASDYEKLAEMLPIGEDVRSIMDVGGGSGRFLREILLRFPGIEKGILFDTGAAISRARHMSEGFEYRGSMEFVEGDFFRDLLPSADIVLMSRVLHDWDDSNAEKILRNVRKSMKEGSRLLIIETIVPEETSVDIGISLNFNLLVMVGGKERTRKEFEDILHSTEFEIKEIITLNNLLSIIVCSPKEVTG